MNIVKGDSMENDTNESVAVKPLNLASEDTISQETMKPGIIKPNGKKPAVKKIVGLIAILITAGAISGYGLYRIKQPKTAIPTEVAEGEMTKGTVVGVIDEEVFRDSAEGEMTSGGIDGEGSHHLVREGGKSQFVYLTSSVIDLDKFVGKQVKVWGETFEAQQAGWLMDIGRLEIIE